MNTVKFTAALAVASSFVMAAGAQASNLSAYEQKVNVKPVVQQLQVTEGDSSAASLSPSLASAINDLSGNRMMPATKVNRWKLGADIPVGSIIDSLIGIPVMSKIGKGTDIVYVQQFATAEEAAKAKKLCPVGIPFLCEKRSLPTNSVAAKQLHANELVSFMFEKSLVNGGDYSKDLFSSKLGISSEDGFLMRGEFEAQVSKIDENRVRVRVLVSKGTRGNVGQFSAKAPFEVFSISMVGGLKITPYVQIDRERLSGTMSVTDLVFDLSTADGAKAYDVMMSEAVSIKDLANPNPFFATDLGPVYQLVAADQAKPETARRVSMVSTMKATFNHAMDKQDKGIKAGILGLGLKIIHKEKETNENSITTVLDENGNKVAAHFDSSSKRASNLKILFGLIGSKEFRTGSTAVLSTLDNQGQPTGEINFVVTQNLQDSKFKVSEQKELTLLLQHRMSARFAQRLNLGARMSSTDLTDANVYTRVVFSNQALNILGGRSSDSIKQAVTAYLAGDTAWANFYAKDIDAMAKALDAGLNRKNALPVRIDALNSLRSNKAFEIIGTGLMMWMMGAQDLESSVAVKLSIRGIGRQDTEIQVGTLESPDALAAAQFVDDQLNDYADMTSTLALNATIVP